MATFQHNYEFLFLVENLSKNSPFQFFLRYVDVAEYFYQDVKDQLDPETFEPYIPGLFLA